jgi:hypothetical protein
MFTGNFVRAGVPMKPRSAYSFLCTIGLATAASASLSACPSSSTNPPPAAGTGANPAAGQIAVAGSTGVSGKNALAGGGASGTGAVAGAGVVAGMGMSMGTGGGAAGASAMGGTQLTCATASKGAPAALHAAVVSVLLPAMPIDPMKKGPCAFSSCHDLGPKKANLILDGTMVDLNALLVGKAACEVPTLKLVDGSGGDAALANSWLWQKLSAPADSTDGQIKPNAAWGTAMTGCSQSSGQTFGVRMPASGNAETLPDDKLKAVRDWICAGAPKP